MSLDKHLVVFAKAPRMGRVKRRLAAGLGLIPAWSFYRKTQRQLLNRLSSKNRWRSWIAVTPDKAANEKPFWPRGTNATWIAIDQGPGDLGIRMARMLYELPPGPVVIVGTDIPGLNANHVEQAFKALNDYDAVFGPSHDGGYYLVGIKRRPAIINPFFGVRWSTEYALSDTLENLIGYRVAFLETLTDVDTVDDLLNLQA